LLLYLIGYTKEHKRSSDKKEPAYRPWQALANKPDAYLKELADQFDCTATAVFYALEKLNMTRKKRALPSMKYLKNNGQSI
jgi:hypothetical protein